MPPAAPSSDAAPDPSLEDRILAELSRPMGRPRRLTLERVRQVAAKIAKGMSHESACALLDVNYGTWRSAMEHEDFSAVVKKAGAIWIDQALSVIQSGVPGWTGFAWTLERRHPADYRRAPDVEMHSHQTNALTFTPDQLAELRKFARENALAGAAVNTNDRMKR